jgi:hypothetical protein
MTREKAERIEVLEFRISKINNCANTIKYSNGANFYSGE